jgi:hypothetical protein
MVDLPSLVLTLIILSDPPTQHPLFGSGPYYGEEACTKGAWSMLDRLKRDDVAIWCAPDPMQQPER